MRKPTTRGASIGRRQYGFSPLMHRDSVRPSLIEQRVLRWLFVLYCLFILYGTFIPFRFSSDPVFIAAQWRSFFPSLYVNGVRQFSPLDVVSNVLLFVPFGFFWVGSEFGKRFTAGFFNASVGIGLIGGIFALGIELGQLYSPGRTASILDAFCNSSGAALGGILGYIVFGGLRGALGDALLYAICYRPALVLLGLVMIVPLADAYYPFEVSLDVSTVWNNLKSIQIIPFARGFHRSWLDLLIEKSIVFGAIGYLAVTNIKQSSQRLGTGFALVLCLAFAFSVEAGKLIFVGRVTNIENFIFCAAGAIIGVLVIAPIGQTPFCRSHARSLLFILVLALISYSEISPFDWVRSDNELRARWARIEWLPLGAYYAADPQSTLFDLGKKFFLVGPLGILLAASTKPTCMASSRTGALIAGLVIGSLLEAAQIALRSRTPSVTDVLLMGVASWTGAAIFEHWAKLRNSLTTEDSRRARRAGVEPLHP